LDFADPELAIDALDLGSNFAISREFPSRIGIFRAIFRPERHFLVMTLGT